MCGYMCYRRNFSYPQGTFLYSKDLYVFCWSLMNRIILNFKMEMPRRKVPSFLISVIICISLTAFIFFATKSYLWDFFHCRFFHQNYQIFVEETYIEVASRCYKYKSDVIFWDTISFRTTSTTCVNVLYTALTFRGWGSKHQPNCKKLLKKYVNRRDKKIFYYCTFFFLQSCLIWFLHDRMI